MGLLAALKNAISGKTACAPSPAPVSPRPAEQCRVAIVADPSICPAASVERAGEPTVLSPADSLIKKRILFVDDDPAVLQQFKHDLNSLRHDWDVIFASSGEEALRLMAGTLFDAVVTDLHVPGMSGVELFNEIATHHPQALRFIRCESTDREIIKQCRGTPPVQLAHDTDAKSLESVVERAFRIEEWMADDAIKKLIGQLHKLPSLPTLYTQVAAELQSPDASIEFVARLIAKDPVMAAKMLQVVNSAFFGLPREISKPVEAVMFLGAERTKSLILLAHVFSQFDDHKCAGFSADHLWQHSMATGSSAMLIAQAEGKDLKMAETACTAGLLHDIGKLLLAANLPEQYSRCLAGAKARNMTRLQAEREVFGATHAELGACLLGIWNLPLPILEAIAWHHCPGESNDKAFSLLTAVHVASALEHEKSAGTHCISQIDLAYLARLGLTSHINHWRDICGCAEKPEMQSREEKLPFEQLAKSS